MDNVEIWKDCKGYNGKYQISNMGRVWSVFSQRTLSTFIQNSGYETINLVAPNGKRKNELIHRLVALAFIPRIEGKNEVNHIDENKLKNVVVNLEWCTRKENNNHGNHNKKMSASKSIPVTQFDKQGNFIKHWKSASEVQSKLGIDQGTISKVCIGKTNNKTAGGFIWKFTQTK